MYAKPEKFVNQYGETVMHLLYFFWVIFSIIIILIFTYPATAKANFQGRKSFSYAISVVDIYS